MQAVKTDLLVAATDLQELLDQDYRDRDSPWADHVHFALGQLHEAIQDEIHMTEASPDAVGGINPDFHGAPSCERHSRAKRDKLIKLDEKLHLLRADIRKACHRRITSPAWFVLRAQDICDAVEKMRHEDNHFVLATINSNPGAGD